MEYFLDFLKRKLETERAKVGLHKEKIRKDYDLMTSQLSGILKDEQLTKSFLDVSRSLICICLFFHFSVRSREIYLHLDPRFTIKSIETLSRPTKCCANLVSVNWPKRSNF